MTEEFILDVRGIVVNGLAMESGTMETARSLANPAAEEWSKGVVVLATVLVRLHQGSSPGYAKGRVRQECENHASGTDDDDEQHHDAQSKVACRSYS